MTRTGRRPGNQSTRETIIAAARVAFAERGYDGASIRLIAAEAGVDPALVHHYFGTKERLFLDVMQSPIDPSTIIPHALAGGVNGAGERIIRTMLRVWDSPAGGAAAAMIRSAVANEVIARMLREFIVQRILRPIARELSLDPSQALVRLNLVASQIAGLILVRYIIKVEPLASLDSETIVALVAPTVQRYLSEPLPLPGEPEPGDAASRTAEQSRGDRTIGRAE